MNCPVKCSLRNLILQHGIWNWKRELSTSAATKTHSRLITQSRCEARARFEVNSGIFRVKASLRKDWCRLHGQRNRERASFRNYGLSQTRALDVKSLEAFRTSSCSLIACSTSMNACSREWKICWQGSARGKSWDFARWSLSRLWLPRLASIKEAYPIIF